MRRRGSTLPARSAARRWSSGFSLIEVALALGIVAFVLMAVFALLPIGFRNNQISAEETQAVGILTLLESDLRNTHPNPPAAMGVTAGQSLIFGLPVPYKMAAGQKVLNDAVALNTVTGYTATFDDRERPAAAAKPRYEASVIYTRMPAAGSSGPIEARLVVNWPPLNLADPALGSETQKVSALTTHGRVAGYVEAYVTFAAP